MESFFLTFLHRNHGLGFKNIIATVEKYQGEYYMDSFMENGEPIFKISIAIPKAGD